MISDAEIRSKLEAKRRAVEKARKTAEDTRKKLETAEAELRGYEEAVQSMIGTLPPPVEEGPAPKRGLSGGWKAVIAEMARNYYKDFTLDEIGTLAAQNGISATRDTVRSQMHGYAAGENTLVKRVSPGVYTITPAGIRAAGVTIPIEVPTETAGADETPAVP